MTCVVLCSWGAVLLREGDSKQHGHMNIYCAIVGWSLLIGWTQNVLAGVRPWCPFQQIQQETV